MSGWSLQHSIRNSSPAQQCRFVSSRRNVLPPGAAVHDRVNRAGISNFEFAGYATENRPAIRDSATQCGEVEGQFTFGHAWETDPLWQHHLVRSEVDLDAGQVSFYRLPLRQPAEVEPFGSERCETAEARAQRIIGEVSLSVPVNDFFVRLRLDLRA